MKSRLKTLLCLMLAVLMLVGCKETTPSVNLGSFEVKLPGTYSQNTEQLPLTEMGLGTNTPLVMTTAQSMPNSNELYLAISVEWEQTLNALTQQKGQQWDQKTYTDSIQQIIIDQLTLDATVGEQRAVNYGKMDGFAVSFDMTQSADNDLTDWPSTKGEIVSFVTQKRLIILVYAAEQSAFNSRHKESYFSSLLVK